MHDGAKIQIGERELVMPKLTAGILKRHWPKVAALRERIKGASSEEEMLGVLPEMMGAQVALIHAALRRNYPDLAIEDVEDGLELASVKRIFETLVTQSHMEKKGDGEEGEAGRPQS